MGQIEQHTPEPWIFNDGTVLAFGKWDESLSRSLIIADTWAETATDESHPAFDADEAVANARRIVAAINFCAGRSTEWLEPGGDGMTIYEGLDTIATDRVLLEAERDALQGRLDALVAAAEAAYDWLSRGSVMDAADVLRVAIKAAKGVRS
jgi:hypothetical protein